MMLFLTNVAICETFEGFFRSVNVDAGKALNASLVGASNVVGPFKAPPNKLLNPGVFRRLVNVDSLGLLPKLLIKEDPESNNFEEELPQPAEATAMTKLSASKRKEMNFFIHFNCCVKKLK